MRPCYSMLILRNSPAWVAGYDLRRPALSCGGWCPAPTWTTPRVMRPADIYYWPLLKDVWRLAERQERRVPEAVE